MQQRLLTIYLRPILCKIVEHKNKTDFDCSSIYLYKYILPIFHPHFITIQIRKHEELLPIAYDGNVHAGYTEYRRISPPAKVLPGDRMVVECTYNSSQRDTITLGSLFTRGESCNVFAVYYPRQKKLTTCHSLPSFPTVLHSLGIAELSE